METQTKKQYHYYQDDKNNIKLNTKYIHSRGLLENLCLAIRIALDLNINKKVITKILPKIRYPEAIDFLEKGKIKSKLNKNEKLLIDGCHSEISGKNLADYLKTHKVPIYGIWAMTKNKNPNKFIKQFKGIFKKIFVIPIENEPSSLSNRLLFKIAKHNNFNSEISQNFEEALKKLGLIRKKSSAVWKSIFSWKYIKKKLNVLFNPRNNIRFCSCSNLSSFKLTIRKQKHSWYSFNSILCRSIWFLINVVFCNNHLIFHLN